MTAYEENDVVDVFIVSGRITSAHNGRVVVRTEGNWLEIDLSDPKVAVTHKGRLCGKTYDICEDLYTTCNLPDGHKQHCTDGTHQWRYVPRIVAEAVTA